MQACIRMYECDLETGSLSITQICVFLLRLCMEYVRLFLSTYYDLTMTCSLWTSDYYDYTGGPKIYGIDLTACCVRHQPTT